MRNKNLPFRPNIIDIEASGFGPHGYPIEVGITLESGECYCSLIKPQPNWTYWDTNAQTTHNISRANLIKYGNDVVTIANALNTMLAGKTVYSDGWVVDKPWLITLFQAARVPQNFTLSALEMIMSESQMEIWDETKSNILQASPLTRHRASSDARLIQETYYQSLRELQFA